MEKTGYQFAGWNTKPDGRGTVYQPGDSITVFYVDVTLYAQWRTVPYSNIESTIRFEDAELEVNKDGGLTVKRYIGTKKDIVIPSTVLGRPVTEIGEYAFQGKGLTSVKIPDGVKIIGKGAFAKNELTSIEIPSGVEVIGDHAFAENQLKRVEIPSSVTEIGDYAFTMNPLKSVHFNGFVPRIKPNAFSSMRPASKFIGWYTDNQFKNKWDGKTVNGEMTVYSKWSVQISLDGNGAAKGQVQEIEGKSGESVILPSKVNFKKSGYAFVGWNTKEDGTGTAYKPGDTFIPFQEDVMLYAQWKPVAPAVKASNIKITNNIGKDKIELKGLTKGFTYTIFKNEKLTKKLESFTAKGSTHTLTVNEIGDKKGSVYIVAGKDGYVSSEAVKVSFKAEPTPALSSKNVKVTNSKKQDKIELKGLKKGTTYIIYKDAKLKDKLTSFKATKSTKTIKVKQLGKKGRKLYIVAKESGLEPSTATKITVPKEK